MTKATLLHLPFTLKLASNQPQNKFCWFHSDSPCLTMTILYLAAILANRLIFQTRNSSTEQQNCACTPYGSKKSNAYDLVAYCHTLKCVPPKGQFCQMWSWLHILVVSRVRVVLIRCFFFQFIYDWSNVLPFQSQLWLIGEIFDLLLLKWLLILSWTLFTFVFFVEKRRLFYILMNVFYLNELNWIKKIFIFCLKTWFKLTNPIFEQCIFKRLNFDSYSFIEYFV